MQKIFFLSSYTPRRCGIATFTEHLRSAVRPLCQQTGVIAIDDGRHAYNGEVVYEIQEQNFESYKRAAAWVNEQDVDLVHLQHEFSLFGGKCGSWILAFLEELRKPYVATLHTVSLNPIDDFGHVLYEIGRNAEQVIVMSPASAEILQRFYAVKASKISMIRHGAPDPLNRQHARQLLGIDEKQIVVSVFGLIGPHKGLEYAIEAIAQVVEQHPEVHFYILGQTLPHCITNNRDFYREQLQTLVSKLGIESHIHFINRFLEEEVICQWLASSDIFITPYLNRYLSCSGPLTYAMRSGRAIVSTPYPYAKELLAGGRGIIVEFDRLDELSEQLATKISQLVLDTDLRRTLQTKAAAFGQLLLWPEIAEQHAALYQSVLA